MSRLSRLKNQKMEAAVKRDTLSASGSRYEPSTELTPNFLATNLHRKTSVIKR
jgi:hypothetical protein